MIRKLLCVFYKTTSQKTLYSRQNNKKRFDIIQIAFYFRILFIFVLLLLIRLPSKDSLYNNYRLRSNKESIFLFLVLLTDIFSKFLYKNHLKLFKLHSV